MGDLSEHFSGNEFRCRHCGRLPPRDMLRHTVRHLERLRAMVGKPLVIVSGYRCLQHPAEAAKGPGAVHSHTFFGATDLQGQVVSVPQAEAAGFRGIGTRAGWAVHVDLRPTSTRWRY